MQDGNRRGIVMATMLEAEPFVERLSLPCVEKKPFLVYASDSIVLVISGIGKANAAMAALFIIIKYNIGIVYNLGAAGALRREMSVGDIFHVVRVFEPDRPKIAGREPRVSIPDTLDGFESASLATRDRPAVLADERAALAENADLVDMEGASVLQACRRTGARCYLFKIVSDTIEHSRDEDIVENIKRVGGRLCEFFVGEVLGYKARIN